MSGTNIFTKIDIGLEGIILVLLILLNIIDFLEIIPPVLDYVKKIISWVGLAYLLYGVSLTKIFFGVKNKKFDFFIVISYILFIAKNLINVSEAGSIGSESGGSLITSFYRFILEYSNVIEAWAVLLGITSLIVIAFIATKKLEIHIPSMLHIIHQEGPPVKFKDNPILFIFRFLSIFLVLLGFQIIVFNLIMEWLAIAIDAPLLMIGLVFYFFGVLEHKERFNPSNLLYKLGNMGQEFYGKFISLFQSSKIYLGITGLLVLHLLTDIGTFIIPYIFSIHDQLYFSQFSVPHFDIWHQFFSDFSIVAPSNFVNVIWLYLFNVIGIVLLLIFPTIIWYSLAKEKTIPGNRVLVILYFIGFTCFTAAPAFIFGRINHGSLRGIDIITQSILENVNFTLSSVVLLSAVVGIIVLLLTFNKRLFKFLKLIIFVISTFFFGKYVYLYYSDLFFYYLETLKSLLFSSVFIFSNIILGVYLAIAFIFISLFYVGGFLLYIFESVKK